MKFKKNLVKSYHEIFIFYLYISIVVYISNCSNYREPRCCSDQKMEPTLDENSIFLGIIVNSIFFPTYICKFIYCDVTKLICEVIKFDMSLMTFLNEYFLDYVQTIFTKRRNIIDFFKNLNKTQDDFFI